MRPVLLFIASSLDGYIARENGGIDWLFHDNDYGYSEFYDSIDTTLSGYKTHELTLTFGSYPYPDKKNYVFTRQQNRPGDPNAQFVHQDPAAFTWDLKHKEGKGIWLIGGGEIIQQLLQAKLVDEIVVSIHPVVLGSGIPLFQRLPDSQWLLLLQTHTFPSGLVQLHYLVKK